jgi:glutamate transport system substrate-binding protein
MKRRWLVALLLVLAMVAGACGDDNDNASDDNDSTTTTAKVPTFPAGSSLANIQSKGKLVVGTKFDQPLFGLKNPLNGQIEGFDVEIAKLMAQGIFGGSLDDAAKKIEFVETVSKVREPSIQDGKVDIVVATYTINDTRKQVVDFAGPYYVAGQDIMVKKANSSVTGVSDLNGKKVCSVQGSTSIKNVQQQAPQADLSISFDTYSKCAEALRDGRVEAVTTDDSILAGLVKDAKDEFKLVGKPFTKEPYGIGLKRGDQVLRDYLNDRLEAIEKSGEWKKAWDRTVGTAGITAPEPPPIDRYTTSSTTGTTGSSGSSGSSSSTSSSSSSSSSTTTTAKP